MSQDCLNGKCRQVRLLLFTGFRLLLDCFYDCSGPTPPENDEICIKNGELCKPIMRWCNGGCVPAGSCSAPDPSEVVGNWSWSGSAVSSYDLGGWVLSDAELEIRGNDTRIQNCSEPSKLEYTTTQCLPADMADPYFRGGADTGFTQCTAPWDLGPENGTGLPVRFGSTNMFVERHCQPGRYFADGVDTVLKTCAHPELVDEWVATNCTLGAVYKDGADTYIRSCARPGRGKWASPKYENGVMVHIGICKKGAYNEDGYDSNLKPCTMPLLWQYAYEGCFPGSVTVDEGEKAEYEAAMESRTACALIGSCNALSQAEHDDWASRVSTLETGRNTNIRDCSAVPRGEYVTVPCVKMGQNEFGMNIHSTGTDLQTTPCSRPGGGEYAALPCDPGRGWPMAYGLLDADPWNGYCQNSYYGILPNDYCFGGGYGLLPAHKATGSTSGSYGSCVARRVDAADVAACASVVLGRERVVLAASCTGVATTIPDTCTGASDIVRATCTGTDDIGAACAFVYGGGAATCPAGCASTAAFYPGQFHTKDAGFYTANAGISTQTDGVCTANDGFHAKHDRGFVPSVRL